MCDCHTCLGAPRLILMIIAHGVSTISTLNSWECHENASGQPRGGFLEQLQDRGAAALPAVASARAVPFTASTSPSRAASTTACGGRERAYEPTCATGSCPTNVCSRSPPAGTARGRTGPACPPTASPPTPTLTSGQGGEGGPRPLPPPLRTPRSETCHAKQATPLKTCRKKVVLPQKGSKDMCPRYPD